MVQTQNMIRTVATNNEQMLSQTMAVLAAKHRLVSNQMYLLFFFKTLFDLSFLDTHERVNQR